MTKKIIFFVKGFYPLIFLICIYLIFVFSTYKDFGITWDEWDVYRRGKYLYEHLLGLETSKLVRDYRNISNVDRGDLFYNHIYSAFLFLFNKKFIYERYHFLNMLFASLILIASYVLFYYVYKNKFISLLAPVFILLTPRFLGHIPANPKDTLFAIIYFLSLIAIFMTSDLKNDLLKALILGFLFGIAHSLRIIGLTLYPILFFYYLFKEVLKSKKMSSSLVYVALLTLTVFLIAHFFMLITWPSLGSNFFNNYLLLVKITKNFYWRGKVLFMEKEIFSNKLPRSYLPIWLLISTPVYILILFGSSFFLCFKTRNKKIKELLLLFLLTFSFNMILYLIFKPVIYGGLQHFLFLLPIISTVAALSLIEIIKTKRYYIFRNIVVFFVISNGVIVVKDLAILHPYEYIYFNELIGGLKGAYGKFETDYHGASFREASLWLRKYLKNGYEPQKLNHLVFFI